VISTGFGPGFMPTLELSEHDPNVYARAFNPYKVVQRVPSASPPSGTGTVTAAATTNAAQTYINLNVNGPAQLERLKAVRVSEEAA